MNITLIHAYSTTNSGDGLLVDEAAALVREAFPEARLNLIALDPSSFDEAPYDEVLHPITGNDLNPSNVTVLGKGLLGVFRKKADSAVQRLRDDSDLLIAVGGGYLRAKNPVEALKTIAAHGPQLPTRDAAAVYLPQSIGPLRYGTKRIVLRRLSNAAAVHARDDRSLALLSGVERARRSPDLALLGLPAAWNPATITQPGRTIGLVARELPGSRRRRQQYVTRVKELLEHLPDAELLVQAAARGNNDVAFYENHLGRTNAIRTLKEAVNAGADNRPSCVVSVRLHGALESIRHGVPSVHLSYERKGWGAYGDLGVSPYVHNAFDFDPRAIAEQALTLADAPEQFWHSVSAATERLKGARADLVQQLRALARY